MRYIFERRDFKPLVKTSDEVDEMVKDITFPFTDNGFNLEVLYNGSINTYNIFKNVNRSSTYIYYIHENECLKTLNERYLLGEFSDHMKNLGDDIKFISGEIEELVDRIMDIPGINGIDMKLSGRISFDIRVIPSKNKPSNNKKMIIGNPGESLYH